LGRNTWGKLGTMGMMGKQGLWKMTIKYSEFGFLKCQNLTYKLLVCCTMDIGAQGTLVCTLVYIFRKQMVNFLDSFKTA
jgi:hypothetical protein